MSSAFRRNCTYICTDLKFKKFIIEENICIENCLDTKNYKYDFNNICYRQCPLDPDLCALYDEMIKQLLLYHFAAATALAITLLKSVM